MKDPSKSIKNTSNDDDDAGRLKHKSKKRRRDRSLSTSSSDSDDSYTKRKRRRREAKRKRARGSSSVDDSTLRRKGRKRSRKSEGEYRKKSSKVKQKRRTKTRSRRDSSGSSTSDYSSSESCSTCGSSDKESWYRRSKREEIVTKGGSKRGKMKKKESWKGSGREVDRHGSVSSSSCSECRANRAEVTEDARRLVKNGNGDQGTDNGGFAESQSYEDGVSGKDDKSHANHEDGAEDAAERKYIDENERWEMGADNDILFDDSSNIMKRNLEKDPENGNSPHASNIVHDGRGSQDFSTNCHQYEIGSNHCQAGDEGGTLINTGSSDDSDLEAILRQKALENLKRFHGKQQGKTPTLVKGHADGGGRTLLMAKTVGEETGRTSSINTGSTAEGIPDSMLGRGNPSGIRGVEDSDRIGGNILSNYSDSSQARSIMSSTRISTVCNNDENNMNSKVTEVKKAGGGAIVNKNAAVELNRSQKVPHQAAVSKGTPTTMSRERETLQKESIMKPAAASVSSVVHDLEANGTDRVPSVASRGSGSAISNFEQTGSKTMTTEASQYEQKTMSVMRGGEMVQVSYKVYIPKKAPALARRQLQR
ncbi:uncharacterized protein LOC116254801 [Nymphaea colorata]|nr:uncharacterized protein LOC116254801 [Nymphaea colorata]XP_031486254.1 uncharacterized protein LOC116254801 [Nymphaea colorata]